MSTITWNKAVEIFEACVKGLGFEFVGAEMVGSGHNGILRIYADTATGITIEQITQITHQLMGVMEVELPDYRECRIEVSSPGLDRPLFKLADFQRFVGQKARITLHTPLEGQRHFNGQLIEANAQHIVLKSDEKSVILAFDDIEKAKLIPDISFKPKKDNQES